MDTEAFAGIQALQQKVREDVLKLPTNEGVCCTVCCCAQVSEEGGPEAAEDASALLPVQHCLLCRLDARLWPAFCVDSFQRAMLSCLPQARYTTLQQNLSLGIVRTCDTNQVGHPKRAKVARV